MTLQDRVLGWAKARNWQAPWKGGGIIAAMVGAGLIFFTSPGHKGTCETNPLRNVYSPQRLTVVEKCKTITGVVMAATHEKDDDWHVSVLPDDRSLLNDVNRRRQHGWLVVEFVPGDRKPARFRKGMRLRLTGTYALDRQHGGWAELHPVFSFQELAPGTTVPPDAPEIPGD